MDTSNQNPPTDAFKKHIFILFALIICVTMAARVLGSNSVIAAVPGVVGTLPWRHPVQKDGGSLPFLAAFRG